MKNLLKKLVFGRENTMEYQGVSIADERITEKVYLTSEEYSLDVSDVQYILCMEPVTFGVWLTDEQATWAKKTGGIFHLHFTSSAVTDEKKRIDQVNSSLTLALVNTIEEREGTLFVLQVLVTNVRRVSYLKRVLLFFTYYHKAKQTFFKFNTLLAAYSYPRKTSLVSFQEKDYFNLFPMDLIGEIKTGNRFVFGLRHSNSALERIIQTGKLVLCDVSSNHKTSIYQLGKHHVSPAASVDNLPFSTRSSQQFGFPFPDWVDSYREIKITRTLNLGSQMLLWGESSEKIKVNVPSSGNLFHVHFTHYADPNNTSYYPLA